MPLGQAIVKGKGKIHRRSGKLSYLVYPKVEDDLSCGLRKLASLSSH